MKKIKVCYFNGSNRANGRTNKIINLLVFLLGFFIHYIILVITTIKVQKGSE